MKYRIINSGSDGNAIILNDEILLDCGVSFKQLEPYYKKLKLVCITHVHKDHCLPSTIKRLAKERPTLRFLCGDYLVDTLIICGVKKENIDSIPLGVRMKYKRFCYSSYQIIPRHSKLWL